MKKKNTKVLLLYGLVTIIFCISAYASYRTGIFAMIKGFVYGLAGVPLENL